MWLLFVVILIVVLYFYRKNDFWRHLEKIPGPPIYPVLGNVFIYNNYTTEKQFRSDREHAQDFYPIYKLVVFNLAFVALICPEDIEIVMTSMKHIEKAPMYSFLHSWLGTGLLTSTGEKWQNRRKILTPAFHFSILQEFVHMFNEETAHLTNALMEICHEPYINVLKPITNFTLASIADTAMGTNLNTGSSSQIEYKKAIYDFGKVATTRLRKPWLFNPYLYSLSQTKREETKVVNVLHQFTNDVIKERKKTFKADEKLSYSTKKRLAMLDLLLSAKQEGANIDDEGIREEVDTFMFEGHDTTSMAICYTLMTLANNIEIQNEIYEEILEVLGDSNKAPTYNDFQELKFMERCIKECLRLYPSVPFIARVAGEDIKTHTGYTIPKGCAVNIYIYDLHHSPYVYPEPEKFDPDRFLPENVQSRHPFAYLPFSAGPRNCIGQKFAILELKSVLCGILGKFILEPVDRPKDIVFLSDMVLRPKGAIRVKFVPRK